AAKTHQTEPESACRAGTGFIAMIKTEFFGNNVGKSAQRTFQNLQLILTCAFLRPKHSGRATLPEQWIFHIDCCDNLRQLQIFRVPDSLKLQQICNAHLLMLMLVLVLVLVIVIESKTESARHPESAVVRCAAA